MGLFLTTVEFQTWWNNYQTWSIWLTSLVFLSPQNCWVPNNEMWITTKIFKGFTVIMLGQKKLLSSLAESHPEWHFDILALLKGI